MIEKNEDNTDNDNSLVRIRLITDKRTFLEKRFLQVQEEIKICFAQLAQTLYAREKQLLRQSEAIYRQQISLALSSQEIFSPCIAVLDEKNTLEEQIKQFGKIELTGSNSTAITNLEPYKVEEYQDIDKDHVCFDKSIKSTAVIPSKSMEDVSIGLNISNEINSVEKSSHISNFQNKNFEENLCHSSKTDIESQKNDFNLHVANADQQEDGKSYKNSRKNVMEEQHNSYGHTEQVQQWLDQILLETEIEPTIHEVEKLPEISDSYVCTKLQLET